jgi:hypothetical protein
MRDWQTLLGDEWEDVGIEYGPHSQAVVSAMEVLGETVWFKQVGKPKLETVVAVSSWEAAIGPLSARTDPRYGPHGHLLAPSMDCIEVIESNKYGALWQRAREDAFDYCNVRPYIPRQLVSDWQDVIDEYVYEFVSFLLAEIVGAESMRSTYFREMLAWFHAGYFPCGWEGEWPGGWMRVF